MIKGRSCFSHTNNKTRTAIFAGTLSLVFTWFVAALISTFVVDKLDNIIIAGNYVQDSWTFYGNSHLLEEMEEGTYHPLRDPAFVMSILLMYAPSFLAGSLVSRLIAGASNNLAPYITVGIGMLFVTFFATETCSIIPVA